MSYGEVLTVLKRNKGRWMNAAHISKVLRQKSNTASLFRSLRTIRKIPWVEKRKIEILLENSGRRPVWHYRVV